MVTMPQRCTLPRRLRHETIPSSDNAQIAICADDATISPCCSVNFPTFRRRDSRGRLGQRWMDYQGMCNWEGLLHPLDETLRSEILRYGCFVDAAYKSFDVDLSSPTYASLLHPKDSLLERCGCHDTGYRVTRNLHATSSIQLPEWACRGPTARMAVRSSWIGYVAVCQDRDEIARLGRRDVVIAYRGTVTCLEWLENFRANLSCLNDRDGPNRGDDLGCTQPMVESGFLSLYTSRTANRQSLRETVREEVARLVEKYGGVEDVPLSLTITGHSLGAALAILTAYDVKKLLARKRVAITVISFGGPRVGNKSFQRQLEEQGVRVLRIVNSEDPVTRMPGFVAEDNGDKPRSANHRCRLPSWLEERQRQWVYAEVGKELRLSSRESPYLNLNGGYDVAKCHDLRTYLHLVKGVR
ncbi:hypothetical protein MLD38_035358 [Melastoma candidum]|uniref:Uncharacterized protein n=1 Tax=Melastoma candidum TaxID=119954 RepID=A0ACB9LHL7_9MYRT|nr:hypothetical protein MLD38_035358 [Melastoma candidum]